MITPPAIEAYLHALEPAPDAVLAAMEAEGTKRDFPIIGPLVGRLCEQLARSVGARRVFEMGSGFGYSTAWFARAMGPRGRVVHTDGDAKLSEEAKRWLGKAGLADRVEFRVGDALELLQAERGPFDVVFLDVDKEQYPQAFDVARPRIRVGGLLIADNALWHGKVADGAARDAATRGVREFNRKAHADAGLLTTVLPLRDGVSVSLVLATA